MCSKNSVLAKYLGIDGGKDGSPPLRPHKSYIIRPIFAILSIRDANVNGVQTPNALGVASPTIDVTSLGLVGSMPVLRRRNGGGCTAGTS